MGQQKITRISFQKKKGPSIISMMRPETVSYTHLEPDILFVSEPTRGIDIGAKKLVLEYLAKLNRESGMTVIIVSSELVELRSISDRIAIISDGKLSGILKPDDSDADFGLAMSGTRKGGEKND